MLFIERDSTDARVLALPEIATLEGHVLLANFPTELFNSVPWVLFFIFQLLEELELPTEREREGEREREWSKWLISMRGWMPRRSNGLGRRILILVLLLVGLVWVSGILPRPQPTLHLSQKKSGT